MNSYIIPALIPLSSLLPHSAQAAGKVDELLAQLEFICAEEQRREEAGGGENHCNTPPPLTLSEISCNQNHSHSYSRSPSPPKFPLVQPILSYLPSTLLYPNLPPPLLSYLSPLLPSPISLSPSLNTNPNPNPKLAYPISLSSYPILSYPILSYPTLSYLSSTLSYPTLSYLPSTLSFPTLSPRTLGTGGGGFDSVSVVSESSGVALVSSEEKLAVGRAQLQEVNRTWGLLNRVRIALRQRVAFLKVGHWVSLAHNT